MLRFNSIKLKCLCLLNSWTPSTALFHLCVIVHTNVVRVLEVQTAVMSHFGTICSVTLGDAEKNCVTTFYLFVR